MRHRIDSDAQTPVEAESSFAFDVFISYATDPDYLLARALQRFVSSFHLMHTGGEHNLPPLCVCLDSGSFLTRHKGRLLETKDTINAHLARSHQILVLCSTGAARSADVAYEVSWFLQHRSASAVHLAVTEGSAPGREPAAVFPAPVIEAGIHRSIWYDLRGLRGRRARRWEKVRDAGREQVRLVAELYTATGKTAPLSAEELYPDWLSHQRGERRRKRRRDIVLTVVIVAIALIAVAALQRSRVRAELASLADQAKQAAFVSERDPEGGLRSAAQAWLGLRSVEKSAGYSRIPRAELAQTRATLHSALLTVLSSGPGRADTITTPMGDPLLAASGDGTQLAIAGSRGNNSHSVEIWQAEGSKMERAGHLDWPERILCLAIAPNGKQLLVASRRYLGILSRATDGRLQRKLIDLAGGEFNSLSCSSVAISPDGGSAILGSGGGELFELAMQSARLTRLGTDPLKGAVNKIVFASDANLLYVAVWERTAALVKVTLAPRGIQTTVFDELAVPRSLALSFDGRTLYSGHEDGTLAARESATGKVIWRTRTSGDSITDICIVPEGIVAANEAGDLILLILDSSGRPHGPQSVRVTRSAVSGLVPFSRPGTLAIAGDGDPVRLWRTDFAYPIERIIQKNTRGGLGITISGDGSLLTAFGDREVVRWKRSGQMWQETLSRDLTMPMGWSITSASADGQLLSLTAAYANQTPDNHVRVSRVDGEPSVLNGFDAQLSRAAFSPSGKSLAVSSLDRPLQVAVWELSAQPPAPEILESRSGSGATDVVFSRDGRSLAVSDLKGCIYLWRIRQAGAPLTFCDEARMPGKLAFDSSGSQLAAGSIGGSVSIFRISAGSLTRQVVLEGHRRPTTALAFDRSGQDFASASDDGELRFWDTATWQMLGIAKDHDSAFVRQIVAGPESGEVITLSQGGRRISMWDIDPDRAAGRVQTPSEDSERP